MATRLSGAVSLVEFQVGHKKEKTIQILGDYHPTLKGLCSPCGAGCDDVTEWLDQSFQHARSQTDFFLETNWVDKWFRKRAQDQYEVGSRLMNDEQLLPLLKIRKRFHDCFIDRSRCAANYPNVRFHYSDPRFDEGRLYTLLIYTWMNASVRKSLSQAAALPGAAFALAQTGLLARNAVLQTLDTGKLKGYGKKIAAGVATAYAGSKGVEMVMDARMRGSSTDIYRLLDAIVMSDHFESDVPDILDKINKQYRHMNSTVGQQMVSWPSDIQRYMISYESPVKEIVYTYHRIRKQIVKLPFWLQSSVEEFYTAISTELRTSGRLPYASKHSVASNGVAGQLLMNIALLMDVYLIARLLYYLDGSMNLLNPVTPSSRAVVYVGDAHAQSIKMYFLYFYPGAKEMTVDIPAKGGPSRCLSVPPGFLTR